MVNFGLNSASILGIFLAVAGAGLYFLRSVRPELARDHDIFFAAVGLLCGFILLFQGWRLDPILQFGQFLLTGSAIFFGVETIRLRGIATEQAKRNTRIVDDERPVSKVYREVAELDELEPIEDRYVNRRLRGTADPRYRDQYEEEDVRRSRSRGTSERSVPPEDSYRKRRPRPSSAPPERSVESWDAEVDVESEWEERPSPRSRTRPTRPPNRDLDEETVSRPRKRRPPQDRKPSVPPVETDTASGDYVDYQPIDPLEEEDEDTIPRGSEY
ncbi:MULTISPECIES: Ycf66 family protein [unclassified Coleofasciculus]|uniref:Ycf66 family protein n=1 Tax=unclassified Coleofasciculus TaxID=2692782 RepID=UPI00188118ED|nr:MULTISPECIES: Ycf66 family protein [unclassified Coleofasciculus]MBE9125407.1 hypothetical protein [Coleofasciculus sp. LEGE 07081]MBE9147376.1 hypothetical protein [Coleofasciculus sp. LEGE 07092]